MADLNEIMKERLTKIFSGEVQEVTARKLNTTQGNVSKWKNGQQVPTTDMLFMISKTYKVSVDWLLGISDEPEIDGLALEKLTYEQVAKIFDRLIQNKTIERPNLVDVAYENGLHNKESDEADDGKQDEVDPVYDSDHIKIKDRLLAYIMRRRYLLSNPELNMLDVWCERLVTFHDIHLLEYNEMLEQAIDANSPAQFNEGDWAELVQKLSKMTIEELQQIVKKIQEKEDKE